MKIIFKKVESLTQVETQYLWTIFHKSYTISLNEFKIKQKTLDKYALYFNDQQEIIGYTGIRNYSFELGKKKYRAIYFGQTVIEKAYRGKRLVQNTVIRLLIKHLMSPSKAKLIIWNDSLSYRPYLVLAKNLKSYYPNPLSIKKEEFNLIRNVLGEKYYGTAFCPNSGTVSKSKLTLRKQELELSDQDLMDPHIQYYLAQNPNFMQGHGLITFCPASLDNLFFYFKNKVFPKD